MFESARLKVERADHHISDLETQFSSFKDSNPYSLDVRDDPKSGQTFVHIVFNETIPVNWALIIGDAIHNLHSALDHMTWEAIVEIDGGKQHRNVKFPFGNEPGSVESSCNGIETPSQSVKDMFKAFEAFPGGKGDSLYALHNLDIADKHKILVPIIRAANVSEFTILSPDRMVKSRWIDTTFSIFSDTGNIVAANVPHGGYVETNDDTKVTPEIMLRDIDSVWGDIPAITTLHHLRDKVSRVIDFAEAEMSR